MHCAEGPGTPSVLNYQKLVFTWTQYLHEVAYYCNLDFSSHAIVCTGPPVQYAPAGKYFQSQETGEALKLGGQSPASH